MQTWALVFIHKIYLVFPYPMATVNIDLIFCFVTLANEKKSRIFSFTTPLSKFFCQI